MIKQTLHELYASHEGKVSDKWHLYLTEYDRLLDSYREQPVRLLEIGIQNGGSLEIWARYFAGAQLLIGCDINPDCARLQYANPAIRVVIGDANATLVQQQILAHTPQFDVIIDDGSHMSGDIVKSFALYFPALVDGGIFIAEDLHCSYWSQFDGGLYDPYSSVAFFKRVADVISHEHWGVPTQRAAILSGFFGKYACQVDSEVLAHVHSVEFINSMCVVRKAAPDQNGLGHRVIAGREEAVVQGHTNLNGSPYVLLGDYYQHDNPWSTRSVAPEEALVATEVLLADVQRDLTAQTARAEHSDAVQTGLLTQLSHSAADNAGLRAQLEHGAAINAGLSAQLEHGAAINAGLRAQLEHGAAINTGLLAQLAHGNAVYNGVLQQIAQSESAHSGLQRELDVLRQSEQVDGEFIGNLCAHLTQRRPFLAGRAAPHELELARPGQVLVDSLGYADATPPSAPRNAQQLALHCLQQEQLLEEVRHALQLREERVVHLEHTLTLRDRQLAEIYASSSWRLTGAPRYAGAQVKRVRRLAALSARAFTVGGGVVATLQKASKILQRDGMAGVRRHIALIEAGPVATADSTVAVAGVSVGRDDYAEWLRRYDLLDDASRAAQRASGAALALQPLISVVMPTYNPKPEWLIEVIESVRQQTYANWELCIADDCSPDPAIRPILERYAREDRRIKVEFRQKNGHISAATNSAIALASGDWLALLDHDDLLSEQALYWVAEAINHHPQLALIYSDEDKVDAAGQRYEPYFKCDWNPDLFYSHNMISHLGVYRADIIAAIGGFRLGMEGSQDYDLALRTLERIEPSQIYHIARVLYHWRVHAESTASSADAKPYAMLAGERAINEHFARRNIDAKAELVGFGYRVRYALPTPVPLVSLLIPTRNGLLLLRTCIDSILTLTTYPHYEIVIIDNGSDDEATLSYLQQIQSDARVRVVRDARPFNYSALNNAAVPHARGTVLGLINNDLEVISPDWLTEMVGLALQPEVGAVGARLWYPTEQLQHGGVVLGLGASRVAGHAHDHMPRHHNGYFGRAALINGFSAVSAACLVIRKATYEAVGGLNEVDLRVAFNDVDFCLRVRELGLRNVWTPYADLYHHESASRGHEDSPEKRARFEQEVQFMQQRWGALLLNDPAYSPNLTLDHGDFSLAWPPRSAPR
jgi:glycosyltransferase involved in cell wall biosynthesis